MIIYSNPVKDFITDCSGNNPAIAQIIADSFKSKGIGGGAPGEFKSWLNSLPEVAKALKKGFVNQDVHVSVEYRLIDTKQRVDFLIYGLDGDGKENVVLVELKQWSSAKKSNLKDYVVTDGGHGEDDYWHPSYQALNYAGIMSSFNEYIYTNGVLMHACSFLHNMPNGYGTLLNDQTKFPLVKEAPSYLRNDGEKLADFISKYVKKPYENTLFEIDSSKIRPSEQFAKMVSDAIKGQPFFSYDQEQAYSVSRIVSEVNKAIETGERATIIIKGGPGSGKSIVAINAMGQLLYPSDGSPRKNVCYVTANFTPRTYFGQILATDFKKKQIKELFKTPAAFAKSSLYDFDCIIVDEAHRMLPWKFGWGQGKDYDAIEKVFYASRVNVFLIDEDQIVTEDDSCTIDTIKKYAEKYGSKIIEEDRLILSSQFRCVGGEQYVEFVNKVLGYKNDFLSLKGVHYQVKVFDSPQKMIDEARKINASGHQARILSGDTKEWVSLNNPSAFDFDYGDGYRLKWNVRKPDRAAVLEPGQEENVFCIHTIQGLEVEYAAVIIGKDLTYDPVEGKLVFHKEANCGGGTGIGPSMDDTLAEKLIRNAYKVLLTRGVKGTFIYAEDPDLNARLQQIAKW